MGHRIAWCLRELQLISSSFFADFVLGRGLLTCTMKVDNGGCEWLLFFTAWVYCQGNPALIIRQKLLSVSLEAYPWWITFLLISPFHVSLCWLCGLQTSMKMERRKTGLPHWPAHTFLTLLKRQGKRRGVVSVYQVGSYYSLRLYCFSNI